MAMVLRSPYMTRKYVKAGMRAARAVGNNQQARKIATTLIQSAWRGYKARSKKPPAKRRKSTASRSFPNVKRGMFDTTYGPSVNGFSAIVQKDLERISISMPEIGNGSSKRLTNRIYVKGISFCWHFINPNPYPIEVHFALLQMPSDILSSTNWLSDFFRADNGGETSLNFEQYETNPNWDNRYLCNPINPENKRIITHRRWVVGGKRSDKTLKESNYIVKAKKYFPIKRVLSLENSTDQTPEKPYVYFMWAMSLDPADHDATTQKTVVTYNLKRKMYYKNLI